ncbi:hypothetical protein AAG570_002450 [Ranatra chinensis]|uniref:Ell-associated factor Eaf n=1 Tax=Ranatra chinensis TaxID=642074 RepID=A0ABD0Y7K8_9HEMI
MTWFGLCLDDFKPASVTASKHASVEIGPNQEVTVTHLDTGGTPQTVFKGSQRPYHKECVLIIDRTTGEITLEKLTTNIQLKKTRQEMPKMSNYNCNSGRPPTPVEKKPSPPQSNKHKSSSNKVAPAVRHSPLHVSPYRSPTTTPHTIHKSPPPIGLDDANDNSTSSFDITNSLPELKSSPDFSGINFNEEDNAMHEVGILSDSSSDSSSDSNSSDSESDNEKQPPPPPAKAMNGHMNGTSSPSLLSMPEGLLNEDLQLSESGSDSD